MATGNGITVERRVSNPDDSNDKLAHASTINRNMTVIECQAERIPSFYDYKLMLTEAYRGISAEIEFLARNRFHAFIYLISGLLECEKFANDRYDLFSKPEKKFGIVCLRKLERDYTFKNRFRRFGLYEIPFSSLVDALFFHSTAANCLIIFSQDGEFASTACIDRLRSSGGSDDLTRIRAPLDWTAIANDICRSGEVICREDGSFDDIHRTLILIGLRKTWQQLVPIDSRIE